MKPLWKVNEQKNSNADMYICMYMCTVILRECATHHNQTHTQQQHTTTHNNTHTTTHNTTKHNKTQHNTTTHTTTNSDTHHTHTLHISNMHRRRGEEGDTETGRHGDRETDRGLDSERHGVGKKSPVTNIDKKKKRCTRSAWMMIRDNKIAKIKLIIFGFQLAVS